MLTEIYLDYGYSNGAFKCDIELRGEIESDTRITKHYICKHKDALKIKLEEQIEETILNKKLVIHKSKNIEYQIFAAENELNLIKKLHQVHEYILHNY